MKDSTSNGGKSISILQNSNGKEIFLEEQDLHEYMGDNHLASNIETPM